MTELINEGEFTTAIEIIADKLGIAVTEIFEIFVNAQAVIGVMVILQCIVVALLCVITYFVTMKLLSGRYTYRGAIAKANAEDDYIDDDDKSLLLFVPPLVGLVSIVLWGIVVYTISYGILKIMCPEYSAIIEIIRVIT